METTRAPLAITTVLTALAAALGVAGLAVLLIAGGLIALVSAPFVALAAAPFLLGRDGEPIARTALGCAIALTVLGVFLVSFGGVTYLPAAAVLALAALTDRAAPRG